jgi:hypothetical protein
LGSDDGRLGFALIVWGFSSTIAVGYAATAVTLDAV